MIPLPCLKQTLGLPLPKGFIIAREIADITISARDLHQLIVLKEPSNLPAKRVTNYDFVVSLMPR